MEMKKTLAGLLVAGTTLVAGSALLSGCQEEKRDYEAIWGKPLSAVTANGHFDMILEVHGTNTEVDGKDVLAYVTFGYAPDCVKAATIVQSEIDDGDNDLMQIQGYYTGFKEFRIRYLAANGLSVEFE